MPQLPLTGSHCSCRRGPERDNCPNCEGTGRAIDWAAYWKTKKANTPTPESSTHTPTVSTP